MRVLGAQVVVFVLVDAEELVVAIDGGWRAAARAASYASVQVSSSGSDVVSEGLTKKCFGIIEVVVAGFSSGTG